MKEAIASTGARLAIRSVPKGELAYLLDHEAERRGDMSETFAAILRVGFGELGLGKLFLRAIAGNERSARLARRFGFTREGVLREEFATVDRPRVDVEYLRAARTRVQKVPREVLDRLSGAGRHNDFDTSAVSCGKTSRDDKRHHDAGDA